MNRPTKQQVLDVVIELAVPVVVEMLAVALGQRLRRESPRPEPEAEVSDHRGFGRRLVGAVLVELTEEAVLHMYSERLRTRVAFDAWVASKAAQAKRDAIGPPPMPQQRRAEPPITASGRPMAGSRTAGSTSGR